MSIQIARRLHTLAPRVLLASALAMFDGCSKANDGNAAAPPNPTAQAQAVQSSIASAQAARAPSMLDNGATAPNAPPRAGEPGEMEQMLGRPPMESGSNATRALPSAVGAPHIYHLGAKTFFLDQASAIGLTDEQQRRLRALRENALIARATLQRKIDQAEQDLWVLTSSEAPDTAKIETKIGEIARLTGQRRMAFIRTVGDAVGVLSDAQRRAVVSQANPMPPGTRPPAPSPVQTTSPQGSVGAMNPPGGMGSTTADGGMAPMGDDDSMDKMGGKRPDSKTNTGGMGHM